MVKILAWGGILKEHMSIEQLILLKIYSKKAIPTTIEELQNEINIPRTSLVEHLRLLKRDSFIIEERDGKSKILKFYPVPEIAEKLYKALSNLSSAYVYALDHIRRVELKDIEEFKKDLEGKKEHDKNTS